MHQNYTREISVGNEGRIELQVPLPPGSQVEVTVRLREDWIRERMEVMARGDVCDNLLDDAAWRY
jgi:hypothetical protein